MEFRLDYGKVLPQGLRHVNALDHYTAHSGLEPALIEIVKLRASQINGCAYCVDMHSKDARTKGETEQRLYGLSVWRLAPYYTPRERAALALTEAMTLIANGPVPDEVYDAARAQFNDEELVKLALAVVMINTWNRLCLTFGDEVGSYSPDHFVVTGQPAPAAVVN